MFAYLGSRTTRERHARGDGITVCRVQDDGSLAVQQVLGDLVNPSFLAINRAKTRLYTVHGDGTTCSSFAIDPRHGRLTWLNTADCQGKNPVHLVLSTDEQRLLVSNHLTGTVVALAVLADGSLGPVLQTAPMTGQPGPHRVEQGFAKPHFNPLDPSGHWMVVPDKGLDRIFVFDTQAGKLCAAAQPHVDSREGAGPRHVAFHPSSRWMYAVNELDSSVAAYHFDVRTGALQAFQVLSLLPDTFVGNSRAAEIEVSRDGRHVYASNRGVDSIEVFAIDAASGRLRHRQSMPSGGRTPRFFALHPQGQWLYALNEDSDTVVCLAVNPLDGSLSDTGALLVCGSPVCMVFAG